MLPTQDKNEVMRIVRLGPLNVNLDDINGHPISSCCVRAIRERLVHNAAVTASVKQFS